MTSHPSRGGRRRPDYPSPTVSLPEDRLPPQNLEAERGVLGAILLDNGVLHEVVPLLKVEDFYRDSHQLLYRAIRDLYDLGQPVDSIILADELRRRQEYERIGGDDALVEILSSVPHAANAKYHAQIVRQKATVRELIQIGAEIQQSGYANLETAEESLDRARVRIGSIDSNPVDRESPVTVRLLDVESRPVEWLWPGRIAIGKVNLCVGDPSLGKGFVTLAMAGTVTTGSPWCDTRGECAEVGSVILLSAEDSLADTIRPRLDAAGADVSKVHAITSIQVGRGRFRSFRLSEDLPRLENSLRKIGDVRLLVIDPVSAYLGGIDEHKNGDVRGLIAPLSELSERHRVAVVLVTHMNKGAGTKALYRATGSLAFIAAARMAWLFCRDRDDPLRRLMLPIKSNITTEPTGLAFRIIDGAVQWEAEPVTVRAEEALSDDSRGDRIDRTGKRGPIPAKTRQAMDWLVEHLTHGPQRHGRLRKEAEEDGIVTGTFYNAIRCLALEETEIDGRKHLSLPPDFGCEETEEPGVTNPF